MPPTEPAASASRQAENASRDASRDGPRNEEAVRIGVAMNELRAGVRRQRAATAALEAARQQLPPGGGGLSVIAELREPVCTSGIPVFGRLLVLARRVMLKLFMGWYLRPVLQQQSRFNLALAQHLGALVDAQRALRRDLEALEEELRDSESAAGVGESE